MKSEAKTWQRADIRRSLMRRTTHVWVYYLVPPTSPSPEAGGSQSEESWNDWLERRRLNVRRVLAQHFHQPTSQVLIDLDDNGKPLLRLLSGPAGAVSISHSGPLTAIAVTEGDAVGIDLERVIPERDLTHALDTFFPGVRSSGGPTQTRQMESLEWWVKAEAVQKASGRGMAPVIESEGVLDPGWNSYSIKAPAGHVAAIALRAGTWPKVSVQVTEGGWRI